MKDRRYAILFSVVACCIGTVCHAPAATLREAAAACGITYGCAIGSAFPDDAAYRALIARECNIAVAEYQMKFGPLQPQQNQFNWDNADPLVAFCLKNGIKVRGHCLLWHRSLPSWLEDGSFNRQQMLAIMENHITTVVGRYKGKVAEWDVVNEAIADRPNDLRSTVWLDRIGPDYLDSAFVYAHRADPGALLYYNDYSGEGLSSKSDSIYSMVAGMKSRGIPVHGVGLQFHVSISMPYDDIDANIKRLGALGLKVSITELDIIIPIPVHDATLQQQGNAYRRLMQVFLDNRPVCTNFLTWGITDKYSWLNGGDMFGAPLPFDENYQPKPAYDSLMTALDRVAPVADPGIIPGGYRSAGTAELPNPLTRAGLNDRAIRNGWDIYGLSGSSETGHPGFYLIRTGAGTARCLVLE